MKKLFLIISLVFLSVTGCYAEQNAMACFQQGFNIAAKAFNSGDRSAFTPVYGMSPAIMKTSPCCKNGMDKYCVAFNMAFMAVQQGGASRTSMPYIQNYQAVQAIDAGLLGF